MNIIESAHNRKVLNRRYRVLSEHLSHLIPSKSSVLDIGCGSGEIGKMILECRNDITIEGIDVLVREKTAIPVMEYNGNTLPCDDKSYDVIMFVDVLHHTDNIERLLAESERVSRKCVIIKDHTMDGWLSNARLNFMDRVGNRRFGVNLSYNYFTKTQWLDTFKKLGMHVNVWNSKLHLYPWPFGLVFDSTLHFITLIENEEK